MKAYIRGTGLISPQETLDPSVFPEEARFYHADFLTCILPDFKTYIPPIAARRMSRLIKMGISSAIMALADANCSMPDAIITGTGLGSVEDTEKILLGMIQGESLMNPTPFIQSTYNTISSQIAIHLKCHQYNSTYVHRSFSFESALQDAMLQFEDGSATTALAGGIDEITANHLSITRRAGHWKMLPVENLNVREYKTPGALAGEGSAFFLLAAEPSGHDYAILQRVHTFYKPRGPEEIEKTVIQVLSDADMDVSDLDAVILGINGDILFDGIYDQLGTHLFHETPQVWYKQLCGEYYTSSGFALWLGANMLKHQRIPAYAKHNKVESSRLQNVLIYNQYRNINHSLILLSRV